METLSSYLEEEESSECNSEEEEENETQNQRDEEPCVQKQQRPWAPSFFYRVDREVHHFVGQDILIQEALDSYAATTWPAIGSGTGLVSIVASLLGAWVTATDLPDALSNLRLNLSKNTRGKSRHTPQVSALPWSFNLEHDYPTSVYHYDYVLAADVVYHHDFHNELLSTMKHFCQAGTKLLWANRMRMMNDLEFGEMKIFMATCREEEEDVSKDAQIVSNSEVGEGNNMGKIESVGVQREEEAALTGLSENEETEGEVEQEDEGKGDHSFKADVLKDGQGESTCEVDLAQNSTEQVAGVVERREEKVVMTNSSEVAEDEEMRKMRLENKKPFSWSPCVFRGHSKDIYHYVGTDIDIYETIDSYGAVMWPAALALCSFMENNRDMMNLQDKTVLELGAGTGLVAVVASLLGQSHSHRLPEILGNLRANVMRNTRGRTRHLPQIMPLEWSYDVGRVYPSPPYRFDYVLAADVVYHHNYRGELLATMSHFCHPRATVVWANKVRLESDTQFMELFKKEFNTTLLAEEGDMKIVMGKLKCFKRLFSPG
ncbi:hypothetical protein WMY93_013495 [Mugilogobius chulae]|uniref:Uncharacterized protein n=1 Tax=Mugilogobius chulae TaxID=88201 RepID=A0AAW0PBI4_9GOBI